jgi:hypothetical protein
MTRCRNLLFARSKEFADVSDEAAVQGELQIWSVLCTGTTKHFDTFIKVLQCFF